MQRRDRDENDLRLSPDEHDFVASVREAYRWPEPSPAARAAFRARLEQRLDQRRGGAAPVWASLAVAGVAAMALAVWLIPADESHRAISEAPTHLAMPAAGDAILALAASPDDDLGKDASLPDEYVAISDLLLGGV
jgi:hypothetical protein